MEGEGERERGREGGSATGVMVSIVAFTQSGCLFIFWCANMEVYERKKEKDRERERER